MSKVLQVVIYKSVSNEEKLAAYAKLALPAMEKAGAKFLARGVPIAVREEGQKTRTVVIEWPSMEAADKGYNGPEYQAALKALDNYKDPLLLVLSSDHKIEDEEQFREVIKTGICEANKGRIVSFGVIPNRPETGFGYIESYDEVKFGNTVSRIKKFIEKPNLELANKLIKKKKLSLE